MMSPVIALVTARTAVLAWLSEHGVPTEHAVPLPVGDA